MKNIIKKICTTKISIGTLCIFGVGIGIISNKILIPIIKSKLKKELHEEFVKKIPDFVDDACDKMFEEHPEYLELLERIDSDSQ